MKDTLIKHLAIVVTFALLVVCLRASATEIVHFDHRWWSDLTEGQQIAAVQGAMHGYQVGVTDGAIQAAIVPRNYASVLASSLWWQPLPIKAAPFTLNDEAAPARQDATTSSDVSENRPRTD